MGGISPIPRLADVLTLVGWFGLRLVSIGKMASKLRRIELDPADYYRSVALELSALKSRVRYLIADGHWLTDGEWKESILRTLLRRHMPTSIAIGRGFIVGSDSASAQIDVLIYDTTRPVLHQDGELVFVTPDAARGVVEVKSELKTSTLEVELAKLGEKTRLISGGSGSSFVGLFAYDYKLGRDPHRTLLTALQCAADGSEYRVVNHVCAGDSLFARFWNLEPGSDNAIMKWYSYQVEELAAGYFLANALETVAGRGVRENYWAWYPHTGKAIHKVSEMPLTRT